MSKQIIVHQAPIANQKHNAQEEEETQTYHMSSLPPSLPLLASVEPVIHHKANVLGGMPHVADLLDGFLDHSSQWSVWKAERRGYFHLLCRIGRRTNDVNAFIAAIRVAVRFGNLERVQAIVEECPKIRDCLASSSEMMDMAASYGHLELLDWLHAHGIGYCTTNAMDEAAKHGHLTVVQWLHANRSEGCSVYAMNDAAGLGHLHVVQWLHANRQEGCTTYAMDRAASAGHLDMVQWLHTNRKEGCTTYAMDSAAQNGHFHVVQWLHSHRNEGCTNEAVQAAMRNGYQEIVRWLSANARNSSHVPPAQAWRQNQILITA